MALTNPTKLINLQELAYFEGKLANKYQTQAVSATGVSASTVVGALEELASAISSLPSAIVPKGTRTFEQLAPSTDLVSGSLGFMWNISDAFTTTADFVEGAGKSYPAGTNVYVANPSSGVYKYDVFSGPIDLSGYKTIDSLKSKGSATQPIYFDADGNAQNTTYALDLLTAASGSNSASLVTAGDKFAWNAKYDKPSTGIPKSDLAGAVTASLALADSAYQKPADGIPESDLAASVTASLALADSAYQKPNGGIPKSDLAGAVTASLDLADSAYQLPEGGMPATDMAQAVQNALTSASSAYQKPDGGIPKSDLAGAVTASLNLADTAYQKPSGGIAEDDLAGSVTASLALADSALQKADITSGSANGTIAVDGTDVAVTGLGGAAYKAADYYQVSGSYKTTQSAVSDPTASGSALSFIDSISQDANGEITVTKKNVSVAENSDIDEIFA